MQKPDFSLEHSLTNKYQRIAGVDEAGRGALAGPVVAAAVVIGDIKVDDLEINDSKKLSVKKRQSVFQELQERGIDFGVGIVDNKIIDEIDILNATNKAFQIAVNNLKSKADYLLVDGNCYRNEGIDFECVIKGDSKSISIAAASIIAKVTRDNLMSNLCDPEFEKYDFIAHKGYGTKRHFELIKQYGISSIHRKSFLVKFINREFELFANN